MENDPFSCWGVTKAVLTMFSLVHFQCISPSSKTLLVFLFLSTLIQVSSLQFHYYPTFKGEDRGNFTYRGSSNLAFGALQISLDSSTPMFNNTSGRVLYKDTFKLWKEHRSVVASFNTSYVLNIQPQTEPGGEGLAFILTANTELPSNSSGQWLGIVNQESNGSSLNQIIAIEFDTRKSYAEDIDNNHVGVDVNSINSLTQLPLGRSGVNLSRGLDVLTSIRYNGDSRNMAIDVSMVNDTSHDHSSPLISLPIDLSQYLPEEVYVGFSGSTGNLTQLNCIISWNFTGQNIERRNGFRLVWILLVIVLSICICCGFTCYLWWRRMRITNSQGSQATLNLESMLENSTSGPHKFRFKELRSATANFHPNNKLGQGGFGPVYKGFLQETSKEVAIKRVSKDSRQGEQEFIAEVMTISCLRHKNLVKLIGWCYERGELLLVYEFLPRGSLDKLLFSNLNSKPEEVILSWDKRYKIICGVASALSYLHDGCERRVLHRDVKASNVMIDSEYNARLGDFGLARMVQHEGKTHHSTNTIAGTPGYIAPECFHTSKASVETDVYGFGVFSMEVVCGQRPSSNLWNRNTHLVDWVWDLYGGGRVLDCVDPQLQGGFDEEEIGRVLKLGLGCCHPNPNKRPTMRVALQVLKGEAPTPLPPNEKPTFMWPVVDASPEVHSLGMEGLSDGGGHLSICTDLSGR